MKKKEQSKNIDKKRKDGSFYTPPLFVNYAHKMIEETLGEDWKERYVVWDNCCGIGNLTKDYCFKELYASTLHQSDIDIVRQCNKDTTQKFQFDFLNDHIAYPNSLFGVYADKLPKGLKDAFLNNKPIVFFINPPYAKNTGDNNTGTKEKVCYTKVREDMKKEKMDACIANLYAQFLYRIIQIKIQFNLSNVYIAVFSPTLFLTGQSFEKFRIIFLNNFVFKKGVQFKAGYFADVADNWGILFSLWKSGKSINKNKFYCINIDIDKDTGKIYNLENKIIYNTDAEISASEWVREFTKNIKTYDVPNQTNGIKIKTEAGSRKGKLVDNALGYLNCSSNNVIKSGQSVGLYSTAFSGGIGTSIIVDNFIRCVTVFSARRTIKCKWNNWCDEYLKPNTKHMLWEEFKNNSIIYSLFESSSNQSSLRNVDYKGKNWNIYNEFFWMSKDEIMQLANDNNFPQCFNDARTAKEDRYVYKKLQTITLSTEAQAVLDKANEIVRNTFKYRGMFDSEHPEYQIMNWDCGWYQIKALAKEYKKSEYDEFCILFKILEEKMRPMVYELGFLRK